MSKITNINEAVSILIQVAKLAQSSGILELEDAALTWEAINYIIPSTEQKPVEDSVNELPVEQKTYKSIEI